MRTSPLFSELIAGTDRTGTDPSQLLNRLATETVRARAGQRLPSTHPPVATAPEDARPPLNTAAEFLETCLNLYPDLVEQWMEAATAAGFRVPGSQLSATLTRYQKSNDLPPAVRKALGNRGEWLAALNPEWSHLVSNPAPTPEEALSKWRESPPAARLVLANRLPRPMVRDLIEATWTEDPARIRYELVSFLSAGDDPDDVPLLERHLESKASDVRQRVVSGLIRRNVPPWREEITALAREFIPGRLTGDVTLPDIDDRRLERFGIPGGKPPATPIQLRARLHGLVALVPPAEWGDPAQIEGMSEPGFAGGFLLPAFAQATATYRDPAWALPVLNAQWGKIDPAPFADLLTRDQWQKLILGGMGSLSDSHRDAALDLAMTKRYWTPDFTVAFMSRLQSLWNRKGYRLDARNSAALARHFDPAAYQSPSGVPENWSEVVSHWDVVVAFRRSMLQSIARSPKS